MIETIEQNPVTIYIADDGRKFRNKDTCMKYEYICHKWKDKGRTLYCPIDDVDIPCYLVHSYDEILEVAEFEHLVNNNYVSVSSNKNMYKFPDWVCVPYSPMGMDYPEMIQPLSWLEEVIEETKKQIDDTCLDISNMKEVLKYENNIS